MSTGRRLLCACRIFVCSVGWLFLFFIFTQFSSLVGLHLKMCIFSRLQDSFDLLLLLLDCLVVGFCLVWCDFALQCLHAVSCICFAFYCSNNTRWQSYCSVDDICIKLFHSNVRKILAFSRDKSIEREERLGVVGENQGGRSTIILYSLEVTDQDSRPRVTDRE